jgi:hypothetical protein
MKTKGKPSRKDETYSLIPVWKESRQSVRQFCKGQDISEHTFRYWYKKYRTTTESDRKLIDDGCFVPVQIMGDNNSREEDKIEIEYPNGVGIKLPVKTNLRIIKTLIKLY